MKLRKVFLKGVAMLYQSQLMENQPYVAKTSTLSSFPVHIHHENEILYALCGDIEIKISGRAHRVGAGQVAIINSMVMHEIRVCDPNGKFLLIEVGPALLREKFDLIAKLDFEIQIYKKEDDANIFTCLNQIMKKQQATDPTSTLWTMGYILQLYSMLYSALLSSGVRPVRENRPKSAKSIESVLKYVYEHYSEDIKIDDVASYSGYCKSGFCKAFKAATGFTFHSYLNLCRVRNAEQLLVETGKTLDDIAELVGMREAKVLCREFKRRLGVTPRAYRVRAREKSQSKSEDV